MLRDILSAKKIQSSLQQFFRNPQILQKKDQKYSNHTMAYPYAGSLVSPKVFSHQKSHQSFTPRE